MNVVEAGRWMRFYANVVGINIWNGSLLYLKVLVAAAGVEAVRGFDIRTIPVDTIFWTWLSSVAVHVILELNKNLVPNPTPPQPTNTEQ